jgi:primase-polymerase (primpol)-like protein
MTTPTSGRNRSKEEIITAKERPPRYPVIFDAIPPELKELPQWVLWRWEKRKERWTKVLYNPVTLRHADATDRSTWGSFEQARKIYCESDGYWDGIGFVFHPDDGFTGIDLDECIDLETGRIKPWGQSILDTLSGYSEFSPTATGIKCIVRGKKPGGDCKKPYADGEVEMYDRNRFFTITGAHVEGTPNTIENRQEAVESIYHDVFDAPRESARLFTEMPAAAEIGAQPNRLLEGESPARRRRLPRGTPGNAPHGRRRGRRCRRNAGSWDGDR